MSKQVLRRSQGRGGAGRPGNPQPGRLRYCKNALPEMAQRIFCSNQCKL
jgi:hypothetical protein